MVFSGFSVPGVLFWACLSHRLPPGPPFVLVLALRGLRDFLHSPSRLQAHDGKTCLFAISGFSGGSSELHCFREAF